MSGFVSLRQAARILGVSRERVREMIAAGLLPAYKVPKGKKFYIPLEAVKTLLKGEVEKDPARGEGGGQE